MEAVLFFTLLKITGHGVSCVQEDNRVTCLSLKSRSERKYHMVAENQKRLLILRITKQLLSSVTMYLAVSRKA